MIVAISDLHAYGDKFADLMSKVFERIDPETDTVVFLGDYVDGGPDAQAVIYRLRDLQQRYPHWVFLKGNHEDMLLDAVRYFGRKYGDPFRMWIMQGGRETIQSYLPESSPISSVNVAHAYNAIPADDLDWMESLPLYHETDKFIFVHAGLEPMKGPAETDPDELLWIRDRFILSPYDWGKRVIAGHTYHYDPVVRPNKILLDTCHHGGGCLTAVLLDEENPHAYEFLHSFRS